MTRPTFLALALLLSVFSNPTRAAEIEGITFPDSVQIDGKTLILNGLGMREATIFSIQVYAMALYVERVSSDADAHLKLGQSARIDMKFVRDVDAEKMRDAWASGFSSNGADTNKLGPDIAKVQAAMADVEDGDHMRFDMTPSTTRLFLNGTPKLTINNPDFGPALRAVWLGPNPPNDSLKEGLLGQP